MKELNLYLPVVLYMRELFFPIRFALNNCWIHAESFIYMASHEEDMSLFPITVFSEIYPSGLFSLLFVP